MLNKQPADILQKGSINDTAESQITLYKLQNRERLIESKSNTVYGIRPVACSETLENRCQLFRLLAKINLFKSTKIADPNNIFLCISEDNNTPDCQIDDNDRRSTFNNAKSQITTFVPTCQKKKYDMVKNMNLLDIGELCKTFVDRPLLPLKICQKNTNVYVVESSRPVSHPRICHVMPLQERCPLRFRAGSDCNNQNSCTAGPSGCRRPAFPLRRTSITRQPNVWGGRNNVQMPPLRTALREQNCSGPSVTPCAALRSRAQASSNSSGQSDHTRQDQPVQLYSGSRLPIPSRSGPTPARLPRPRGAICSSRRDSTSQNRSRNNDESRRISSSRRHSTSQNGNGTYDVSQLESSAPEPPVQNCCHRRSISQDGSSIFNLSLPLNASLPPPRCCSSRRQSASQDRNGSFDVSHVQPIAPLPLNNFSSRRQSRSQDRSFSFNESQPQLNASLPLNNSNSRRQSRSQDRSFPFDESPPQMNASLPLNNSNSRRQSRSQDRSFNFDETPPQMNASLPLNNSNSRRQSRSQDRSFHFDEPQPQLNASFGIRNDTYDVSRQQPSNGGQQRNREEPRGNMFHGTFTMTGSIQFNRDFQEVSLPSQHYSRPNTSIFNFNEYLENHMNVDMVAPRELAVPGSPYVRIDESAESAFNIPQHWQQMLDDRSSIGSEPLSMDISPEFQRNNGGFMQVDNDNNADRPSRSFGGNDSLPLSTSRQSPAPCRRSRAVSVDRNVPRCKNRCRRNTFNRKTR